MKSRNAGDKAIRVPQASRFFVLELYLEHYRTFSNPIALPHHQTLTSALSRETYFEQFPNVRAPAQNPFLALCLVCEKTINHELPSKLCSHLNSQSHKSTTIMIGSFLYKKKLCRVLRSARGNLFQPPASNHQIMCLGACQSWKHCQSLHDIGTTNTSRVVGKTSSTLRPEVGDPDRRK